jgi:hypothetical protein
MAIHIEMSASNRPLYHEVQRVQGDASSRLLHEKALAKTPEITALYKEYERQIIGVTDIVEGVQNNCLSGTNGKANE